jgi:type II secretory pathway component PulK
LTKIVFFSGNNDRASDDVRHFDEFVGQLERRSSVGVGDNVTKVSHVTTIYAVHRTSVSSRTRVVMVADTEMNCFVETLFHNGILNELSYWFFQKV